jgi:enoyl-CoA hydratase/carnithine racemase
LAGATPYLRLFGLASGGVYLAKSALADAENAERTALCRFFAENLSGETAGLRRTVEAGAASLHEAGEFLIAYRGFSDVRSHSRRAQGRVQIIRLNRPDKKNAITRAMYDAMADGAARGRRGRRGARACLPRLAGAFSSGNDLQDFLAVAMGGDHGKDDVSASSIALATAKKPVVSGVDGLAIGIGTTIHLHCDLTLATPGSLFKTPFTDLGLTPEAASSLIAPQVMGHQRAFALLGMGEGFSAQEALDAGLIWKVVEADVLEAEVMTAAEALAAKPPEALQLAKKLVKGPREPVLDRIKEEGALFLERLKSDEAKEAFMAFMARKK